MPSKRKSYDEDEDGLEDVEPASRATKKTAKKPTFASDDEEPSTSKSKKKAPASRRDDTSDEEEAPSAKKSKTAKKPRISQTTDDDDEGPVRTDKDGNDYVDLGRKKRVTVSEFKGVRYIGIREYYTDANGEDKPGKKGVSLNEEQWKILKENMDSVDVLLRRASKNKK